MNAITWSPAAGRFAWKEYRTLRTMWLAVLLLGLVMQLVCRALAAPGADVSAMLFGLALGTTIMFAVGAAAVMFSAEHEDETYQFLSGLPLRWLPMTLGKLAVATLSALALAVVLMLAGWAIGGGRWPFPEVARDLIMLLGVGIFEALAWATLFSLLVKRPLTAVVLALVVGTFAMQLAASAISTQPAALADLATYAQAVPLRLAIVVAAFASALAVARRWLAADPLAISWKSQHATTAAESAGDVAAAGTTPATAARVSRCRLFARLLWQTWRQSWRSLLIPFAVTAFLWFLALVGVVSIPREVSDKMVPLFGLVGFFLPALFGALVFSGDQRRRQYRFLAEHADRPQYVWLARHTVWLGALVIFLCGLALVAVVASARLMNYGLRQYVEQQRWMWNPPPMDAYELRTDMFYFLGGTALAGFGTITAYAIGQLSSMLFRSEIIAAFVSLVLSAVVAIWAAVLLLWNLTGWWFMLPIALGCLLATWLRAPDWLIERNSWRAWMKPALAVVAPLVFVGFLVPPTRLGQLPDLSAEIKAQIDSYRAGDTPAARKTAAMYERAIEIENSWTEHDPVKKWQEENDPEGGMLEIEANLSANQRHAYEQAVSARNVLIDQAMDAAASQILKASQRTTCRFDIEASAAGNIIPSDSDYSRSDFMQSRPMSTIQNIAWVAVEVAGARRFGDQVTVDQLVATVRVCEHLRQGQPTAVAVLSLGGEGGILRSIASWAERDGTAPDQLRELGERLQELFAHNNYDAKESLIADHLLVRDVLVGKSLPLSFDRKSIPWSVYLAFLANELPWERERALRALDAVTLVNIDDVRRLQDCLDGNGPDVHLPRPTQRWMRPQSGPRWPPHWQASQREARSSYLMSMEYELRVPINEFYRQLAMNKTRRRALLLQLALLRYRHDHGKYPAALSELVPEYLKELPLDPYSGRPFNYSPTGLDLLLRRTQYTNYDAIPPETPFIWSAGPDAAQVARRERTSWSHNDDPAVEPTEVREVYYVLSGQDFYWRNEPALVFPLPK